MEQNTHSRIVDHQNCTIDWETEDNVEYYNVESAAAARSVAKMDAHHCRQAANKKNTDPQVVASEDWNSKS